MWTTKVDSTVKKKQAKENANETLFVISHKSTPRKLNQRLAHTLIFGGFYVFYARCHSPSGGVPILVFRKLETFDVMRSGILAITSKTIRKRELSYRGSERTRGRFGTTSM